MPQLRPVRRGTPARVPAATLAASPYQIRALLPRGANRSTVRNDGATPWSASSGGGAAGWRGALRHSKWFGRYTRGPNSMSTGVGVRTRAVWFSWPFDLIWNTAIVSVF